MHEKPPHQTKQVLKDPMQFSKFRYGRVDKATYWVNRTSSLGVFSQVDPSLGHVDEVTWIRSIILGMGFMTYKGMYCLIYGFICRGCVAPRRVFTLLTCDIERVFIGY